MNRSWLITIIVIVGALIIIGVLYENGMLDTDIGFLSILFAALAGPFTAAKSWLGKDRTSSAVLKKYDYLKQEEKQHRHETDMVIKEREERIKELDLKIKDSEKEIQEIEDKKEKVRQEIEEMSIEELQDEAINYFGE